MDVSTGRSEKLARGAAALQPHPSDSPVPRGWEKTSPSHVIEDIKIRRRRGAEPFGGGQGGCKPFARKRPELKVIARRDRLP